MREDASYGTGLISPLEFHQLYAIFKIIIALKVLMPLAFMSPDLPNKATVEYLVSFKELVHSYFSPSLLALP